eukprot:2007947-Karenia_brevis.AAC.1
MPTTKQIDELTTKLHTHFDFHKFSSDVSHLSTSDIWHYWNLNVGDALYSGLSALAKEADMEIPPAKAFTTHGSPCIKEVPLFTRVAHLQPSASTSSLSPGYALQT